MNNRQDILTTEKIMTASAKREHRPYFKSGEVAKMLGVSHQYLYTLEKRGVIQPQYIGKNRVYYSSDIIAMQEHMKHRPPRKRRSKAQIEAEKFLNEKKEAPQAEKISQRQKQKAQRPRGIYYRTGDTSRMLGVDRKTVLRMADKLNIIDKQHYVGSHRIFFPEDIAKMREHINSKGVRRVERVHVTQADPKMDVPKQSATRSRIRTFLIKLINRVLQ